MSAPASPAPSWGFDGPRRRLLDVLNCPLCRGRLEPSGQALRCAERHTFDIARHGYVSLLTGDMRAANADSAPMVAARAAFLAAGHYAPLAAAVAGLAASSAESDGVVLDAGVGTGYYLGSVLDALPGAAGLGLDVSKFALRRAARAHPRAGAAVWDVWRDLPVRSGSADVVLNVFAPRNGPEFRRVLQPGGVLLVVTPTGRHLAELRAAAGLLAVDGEKERRLGRALDAHFEAEHVEPLEYPLGLTTEEAGDLVSMGPTARHVEPEELRRRIGRLGPVVAATASFTVSAYVPR